jgi:hypothetical protein
VTRSWAGTRGRIRRLSQQLSRLSLGAQTNLRRVLRRIARFSPRSRFAASGRRGGEGLATPQQIRGCASADPRQPAHGSAHAFRAPLFSPTAPRALAETAVGSRNEVQNDGIARLDARADRVCPRRPCLPRRPAGGPSPPRVSRIALSHHVYRAPNAPRTPLCFSFSAAPTANS